jgi:hypothetical protein
MTPSQGTFTHFICISDYPHTPTVFGGGMVAKNMSTK